MSSEPNEKSEKSDKRESSDQTDSSGQGPVAARSIKHNRWAWMVWVLPAVAIVMAGWLVYRAIPDVSATITLLAPDANDISANSTLVFHRGVAVGKVKRVSLSEDPPGVVITVDLNAGQEQFARDGTVYWIVKPELNPGEVSGISTIVSGPELHADPGTGELLDHFELAGRAPLQGASPDDLLITLQAPTVGSLRRGTMITFRDTEVGVISDAALNGDFNGVEIQARIFPGYVHLVRTNSQFWNSGGLDVEFGLFSGAAIRAESMQSLLGGGVSFATPDKPGERVTNGAKFELAPSRKDAWAKWAPALKP